MMALMTCKKRMIHVIVLLLLAQLHKENLICSLDGYCERFAAISDLVFATSPLSLMGFRH